MVELPAIHQYQHGLIDGRIRGRSTMNKDDRQQANRRLHMTLVGHLRAYHEFTASSALWTIKDLVSLHKERHNAD